LEWRVALLNSQIQERIDMKNFILFVGLLVFSLGIAGAQQSRTLAKEVNDVTSSLLNTVNENIPHNTRVSTIPVGDLYTDGNRGDYLKYVQMVKDYAAEYDYYIQEVHVKDIEDLRSGSNDGYKNTLRIEESVLPDDTKVVSVFAQLKTMEVVHYFSNKSFIEPHIRKVTDSAGTQGILVARTAQAREAAAAAKLQKDAWNAYLDNVYKGAIGKLQAAQKTMGRAKSPLLDNIKRDIKLLESHNKDHLLFYSK
jgi:hypothetical protein